MRTLSLFVLVIFTVVMVDVTLAGECTQGETKKEDCNDCFCTETGVWACTKKICDRRRAIDHRSKPPECKVGDIKKEDCNRCRCIGYGRWACTRMRCIHKRDLIIPTELHNISCPPNDQFMIECNRCTCNFEGSGYRCTNLICSPP